MKQQTEERFLKDINDNMGIIHKISGIYASGEADREDLKQEMLFHLWKSYAAYQGKAKFSTWMYQVCLNTGITFFKKRKNTPVELVGEYDRNVLSSSAPSVLDKTALLHQALKKLSSINRAIILLYFEELSYREIAEITGLTKANISVRLVRIKKELEKELMKYKNVYYGSE